MSNLKSRVLSATAYELDTHVTDWAKGIHNENQRLKPLMELLGDALTELERVRRGSDLAAAVSAAEFVSRANALLTKGEK